MIKNLFFILFVSTLLLANNFENFLNQENQDFSSYKTNLDKEFTAYKKAYDKSLEIYKKEIQAYWPHVEISSPHQFIQYDKDYHTKKSIDFQNETIQIEVIAQNEEEARDKLLSSWNDLMQEDVKSAYAKDQLESKINHELNQNPNIVSEEKIIADVLSPEQQNEFIAVLQQQPLEKKEYQQKTIYTLNVKLPSDALIKKAQLYQQSVNEYAQKSNIDKELVYAIIHSESSFNPMARSHIPAFGLMQIVPKSAGVDTYNFLYGEKRVLNSDYLHNPNNNIKLGSTYLHMLNFKYLNSIKDPQSRLYCSIAAYNTGAGNVARSFTGTNNIVKASHKINAMPPSDVYKHLMKHLPYSETKRYLHNVNERRFVYLKLIESNRL
ncbi:MAG: murein transglycosylase domain-containing protein [Arcobacteraceae bacterium]